MANKKIPARDKILDLFGDPLPTAKRDVSGEVVWKHPPAESDCEKCGTRQGRGGVPVTEDMNTEKAIRVLIGSIPRDILTTQDSIHATRLWSQITDSRLGWAKNGTGDGNGGEDHFYDVAEAEYDWLRGILNKKKVPLTRDEAEQNKNQPDDESKVKPRTVAQHVWGVNAYVVERALRARREEGEDTEED